MVGRDGDTFGGAVPLDALDADVPGFGVLGFGVLGGCIVEIGRLGAGWAATLARAGGVVTGVGTWATGVFTGVADALGCDAGAAAGVAPWPVHRLVP